VSPKACSAALLIVLGLLASPAHAQEAEETTVNFAYASVFGTGLYAVGDQQAFIMRAPFSQQLRPGDEARAELRLMLPVLVGYYDFDYDSLLGGDLPSDAATVSVVPGLRWLHPRRGDWRLTSRLQLGLGRDLRAGEDALIYLAGLSARRALPAAGGWALRLGASGVYSGYAPRRGARDALALLGVGIDAAYPWGVTVAGRRTRLATHVIYYGYVNRPGFDLGLADPESLVGEIEWGLALAFEHPPRPLGLALERLGVALRYGPDIKGLRLVTEFPF
jgi:hypothetical protein